MSHLLLVRVSHLPLLPREPFASAAAGVEVPEVEVPLVEGCRGARSDESGESCCFIEGDALPREAHVPLPFAQFLSNLMVVGLTKSIILDARIADQR